MDDQLTNHAKSMQITCSLTKWKHHLTSRRNIIRWCLISGIAICLSILLYLLHLTGPLIWTSHQLKPLTISHEVRSHKTQSSDREQLKNLIVLCANKPPQRSKVRNLVWYVMRGHESNSEIQIFSAHFDDRQTLNEYPVLRLLGISTTPKDIKVYCQLWYENENQAVVTTAATEDTGRGISNKGQFYQERLYSCMVPSDVSAVPTGVSLVFQQCDRPTALVPVNIPEKPQTLLDLGICVAVAYGYVDPYKLIEWVEFNKLLGINEINIYQSRMHVDSMKVFMYYQNMSIINLFISGPPVDDWCHWCQKLATIAVLNDCMYRNMYRYRHIMVIDFDEFIIPQNNKQATIPAAIEELEKSKGSPQPAYIIKNAYFFLEFPPESDENEHLDTMRYRTRLKPSERGYAPKSITDPRRCIIIQNHYCMIRTPEVGYLWTIEVSENDLLLHHYKKCHLGDEECKETMMHHFRDNTTLRYKPDLLENVQKAYSAIGLGIS